ncbi:kinase-like domain-containing protein [Mycotypha africana]|uniref:kinase-like domain-containing protein n=1 Tax=Mycotypha africana TaxID=64632 RepID=UPI00230109D9|nr:kinase-like domain-containing protein [Mycotypha africana]KAI8984033.1 kinase-like domain-containing protein [Mycotypha africana]
MQKQTLSSPNAVATSSVTSSTNPFNTLIKDQSSSKVRQHLPTSSIATIEELVEKVEKTHLHNEKKERIPVTAELNTSPAAAFLANFMLPNLTPYQQQRQHNKATHLYNPNDREGIANYIFLDTIGFGGNSIVRKARHEVTGNIVAIKIIETIIKEIEHPHPHQQQQQQQLEQARLERELSIWQSLMHPNIVRLIKTIHVPNEHTYYVVNEYCSGGDLLTYRNSMEVMSEEEMKLIFRQVCEGVRYLHKERNVCHKDLKLENILLLHLPKSNAQEDKQRLQIKICDFGLSVFANSNNSKDCCSSNLLTHSHQHHHHRHHCKGVNNKHSNNPQEFPHHQHNNDNNDYHQHHPQEQEVAGGSLAYIPPEQIRKKKVSLACRKTDIWSLGVILYSLAVGQLPFVNTFELKLQEMILEGTYAIPDNKHLSASLKTLIQGCLAYLPEDRLTIDQILASDWFR